MYGAKLIHALKKLNPQTRVMGIGGKRMREAGANLLFDINNLAVVGAWEVVAQAGAILLAYRHMRKLLIETRPDLLILIDYPDFNLGLAGVAKRHNIKVLYYISPQVWAWRRGRVKKIARRVNKMAVILPFEVPLYKKAGLDVEFVGHPLLEVVKPELSKEQAYKRYGFDQGRPIIGLLPGSRRNEIKFLLEVILESGRLIRKQLPNVQFIMPVAPSLDYQEIEDEVSRSLLPVKLVAGENYDVMNVADLLITASGTATLEAALLETPMVVIYKLSRFSYLAGRLLVKTDYMSLANIIAGKGLVPELLQNQVTPENIASHALKFLGDPELMATTRKELALVKTRLGEPGAAVKTARIAMELINEN